MEINLLNFIMAEFTVETHTDELYTYKPPDGLGIVYYILDMQKLFSENTLEPTYDYQPVFYRDTIPPVDQRTSNRQ